VHEANEAEEALEGSDQPIESMPELRAIVYTELSDFQRRDDELSIIVEYLESKGDDSVGEEEKYPYYSLEEKVLMKSTSHGRVIAVPKGLRNRVMYLFHNHPLSAHAGVDRMVARLKPVYYWSGMDKDIRNWVKGCAKCTKIKTPRHTLHGKLKPFGHGAPFQILQVDIVGPFPETQKGNRYWLTIIDRYTRWLEFVPMPTKTAEDVVTALFKEWIARYGVPEVILSDNGLEFRNNLLSSLSEKLGVRRQFSAPYHPKTNGLCERVHRFAKEALGSIVDSKVRDWDEYLPMLAFAHRTSPVIGLGFSPYEMVTGRRAKLPGDFNIDEHEEIPSDRRKYFRKLSKVLAKMQKVMDVRQAIVDEKAMMMANTRRKDINIEPGASVLVRRSVPMKGLARKLVPKWSGPHKVVARAHDNNNVYVIQVGNDHRLVNIEDIHVFDASVQENADIDDDGSALFSGVGHEDPDDEKVEEISQAEDDIKLGDYVVLQELSGEKGCYLAKAISDGGGVTPAEYHVYNRMSEKQRFYPVWLRVNKRGKEVKYFMTKGGVSDEPMLVSCGKEWRMLAKKVQLESGFITEASKAALGGVYFELPAGRK
jgi:hypothetical protein